MSPSKRLHHAELANRWRARPVLAALLRALIVLVPLGVGYGSSQLALRLLRSRVAESRWWLVLVVAVSVAVCFGVERATRRLLPLAALLKLSMLFPDRAPSRLKLARQSLSLRRVTAKVAQARSDTPAAAAEAALALITALTSHDRRTRGHCERVRLFTELLGEQLRLPRDARDRLRWAALLHDIGKLKVAPEILNKPSKLKPAEWDLVAQHPVVGEELLGPLVGWLGEWGTAVKQHHEKFDGTGYPQGLSGTTIGRAARIIAVADSFEVMTAHRAYKKPMATTAARAELTRCAGTQFDPAYVRAFLAISLPRLFWAMGPGSLLMNLPLLRAAAETANKGVLAASQTSVVAAGAATVIGGASLVTAAAQTPIPAPVTQTVVVSSTSSASTSHHPGTHPATSPVDTRATPTAPPTTALPGPPPTPASGSPATNSAPVPTPSTSDTASADISPPAAPAVPPTKAGPAPPAKANPPVPPAAPTKATPTKATPKKATPKKATPTPPAPPGLRP